MTCIYDLKMGLCDFRPQSKRICNLEIQNKKNMVGDTKTKTDPMFYIKIS
jgi:hypothetical protein